MGSAVVKRALVAWIDEGLSIRREHIRTAAWASLILGLHSLDIVLKKTALQECGP
jgi:hypothetical protein